MTLAVLLCALSWTAWGREIVVSTDGTGAYRSIQRAIDAADYGDVIVVNPGVYEEYVVLKSGITLRGAGAAHTILRSSYGYEPALRGSAVGSAVVESLSIERTTSILEAPAVEVDGSNVVFRDCRVTGGQLGGVRSTGSSRLTFIRCTIEGNLGYGIQVSDGENVRFQDCVIEDNGSTGIQLWNSVATLDATVVEWNESDGLLVGGSSTVEARQSEIAWNGRWGIQLEDTAVASLDTCHLITRALGNARASDATSLCLIQCTVEGGSEAALSARDSAQLDATDTQITRAGGQGVRATDSATVALDHSFVALCGEDGLSIAAKSCRLRYATIAYNGGDGLCFGGQDVEAIGCIVAVNAGVGVRLSSTGTAASFAFNNVWGNGSGDYEGTQRPSSDISEPPDFVNPVADDFALDVGSSSVDAGPLDTTLGAWGNPWWAAGGRFGIHLVQPAGRWGAWSFTVEQEMTEDASTDLGAQWSSPEEGSLQANVSLSWIGWSRLCARVAAAYAPEMPFSLSDWVVQPEIAAHGVANGAASYWRIEGGMSIASDAASVQMSSEFEGPTGITRQLLEASWGCLSLSAGAIDFALTDCSLHWTPTVEANARSIGFDLGVDAVPEWALAARIDIESESGVLRIAARSFLQQMGTATATIAWGQSDVHASVTVRLREKRFEDVDVAIAVAGPVFSLSGALGASAAKGPRIRLDLTLDTSRWLAPTPNEPPIPAFTVFPPEPEAGEPIAFDASATIDPDGAVDQVWWDFGDGSLDIGPVVEHTYSSSGTYSVTLTVSDNEGAVTTLVDAIDVRAAASTPVAAFTWAPVSPDGTRLPRDVRSGDRILLDASGAYDPNGLLEEYSWDLQSDGTFDVTTSEPRIVIDPLEVGAWPVTLRVVDADGNADAIMHVLSVAELKPPIADFDVSPDTPAVGDPIRFLDASTSVDGAILSWEWDFGDGHLARKQHPTHRYEDAGTYEIQLTVRDSEGLVGTVSAPLIVEANPELVPIQQVWALLIGITNYDEVPDLSYASEDAAALADWLASHGVEADHIRLLTDSAGSHRLSGGEDLTVQPATLVNVREALGWLRQVAQPEDLVLIHFSGHGYQGADDNLDEADGVDEFFVLQDTRAAAKDDTALRDDEFGRFLDRIASEHVLVFFDSCYSGGLSRSLVPGARAAGDVSDVFGDFRLEGRLILSASQEDQDAFESPQLEHGVLTHFLLKGLAGSADLNGDGHITAWELFGYVREEVPPFVKEERGETQIPQLIGEGESRIVLAQSPTAMPLTFSYSPAIPFAGAPVTFRSESDAEVGALSWAFGDGGTADGTEVSHVYTQPGSYTVLHTLVAGTDTITAASSLTIASPASIASIDESGRVVLTVGRGHGVAIGDRFGIIASSETGESSRVPVLEVVEALDEASSACILLDPALPLSVGDAVFPIVDDAGASHVDAP